MRPAAQAQQRRGVRFLVLSVAASLMAVAPQAAGAATTPVVASHQVTATVLSPHVVRTLPGAGMAVGSVMALRPITAGPTVLPVLAAKLDARGRSWLQVRLPGRVLHQTALPPTGWIVATGTRRGSTSWHVVADVNRRQLNIYRAGALVRQFRTIVGTRATPTPRGAFFVEESVIMPTGAVGGPFALATSARSAVLQEFAGGPGQIAIHGLLGVGGTLGTAASHGCVRVSNAVATWLSTRIAPGTPMTIV